MGRGQWPWTPVILLLVLTACGARATRVVQADPGDDRPAAGTPLLDGDRVQPAAAERLRDRFERLEQDGRERQAASLDALTERTAWRLSGLEESLGGPARADATFAALYERQRAALPAVGRRLAQPSAFGRGAPPAVGDVSQAGGAALFGALLVTAFAARAAANLPDGTNTGSASTDGTTRSATRDTGTVTTSKSTTIDGVEATIESSATVRPCPDPDGVVIAEGSMGATVRKGSAGVRSSYRASVRIQVGDDAEVASETHELRSEQGEFGGGRGHYVDVSVAGDQYVVNRAGGRVTQEHVEQSVNAALFLGWMLVQYLQDAAKEKWQSGACVRLDPAASKGPTALEPGDRVTLTAAPRSKLDGRPTGGTVSAVLSAGGAAVEPSGSTVPADATFTYTAPAKRGATGDVDFEARSRRGVGRASLHLDTYESSFVAEGGGGEFRGRGVICSLTRPFTISGSGLTLRFTPTAETSGRYVLTGRAGGVGWSGDGTYRVRLNEYRNSGTLVATGTNTVRSPLGSYSDRAEARFDLSSVRNCD